MHDTSYFSIFNFQITGDKNWIEFLLRSICQTFQAPPPDLMVHSEVTGGAEFLNQCIMLTYVKHFFKVSFWLGMFIRLCFQRGFFGGAWGLVTQATSVWHVPISRTPKRKAGIQHKQHYLHKWFMHSEIFIRECWEPFQIQDPIWQAKTNFLCRFFWG